MPLYPLPPDLPSAAAAHAASHAPGGTDDVYSGLGHRSATMVEPFPAWATVGNGGLVSGTVYLDYFTADTTPTLANFLYNNRGVASSGLTLARLGLYSADATTLTLRARSAASTTLGNTVNLETTLPFDTASGYPANYLLTRGALYALAVILVGTTPGNMPQGGLGMNGPMSARILAAATFAGQSDLPATIARASAGALGSWFYMAATT